MKRPLRKLARDIFDLAVLIFGLFMYLHRKKKIYMYMYVYIYIYIYIYIYGKLTYVHTYAYTTYMQVQCVFYIMVYSPGFHGTSDH